jgi:hypothetical protein
LTCNGACSDEEDRLCPTCGGEGFEEFGVPAADAIGPEYSEYVEVIHSIFTSRERAWSPLEWYALPPRWVAAYWATMGDLGRRHKRRRDEQRDGNSA